MLDNRWFVLLLLFVSRLALGFQFQSAGSVAPFLIHDFGIDYTQVGTLVGLYMLPGIVVAIPSGLLGQRFGDKQVVLFGMVLMMAGGIISGLADRYAEVMIGRVVSGTGATFLVVLMTKMLADWFADKELFIGMSIFVVAWPLGIAAGQATQSGIAEAQSWNAVFLLSSVLLLACSVLIALLYRPIRSAGRGAAAPAPRLATRDLWLVCIAGAIWMASNSAYLIVLNFGPTVLIERGTSIVDSGLVVSLMSWISIGAIPLGGYLANRFNIPAAILLAGTLISAVIGLAISFSPGLPAALFMLFGLCYYLALPVIAAMPAQIIASQSRGPGFGIYWAWFYVGVPVMTASGGLMKDRTGTAESSIVLASLLMLVCFALFLLLRSEQRRLATVQVMP